jgi:outer membrane protein
VAALPYHGDEAARVNASAGGRYGIGALLLALALLPSLLFAQGAGGKIGYMDIKRLIDNAPQMAESRAKLEREFAPRDAALKTDEKRLADLKQRYERDGAIMAKPDAEALKREIDTLDRSIKRTREDLRGELTTRAAAERDRIWQQLNDIVIEYARQQGYDLIVPSPVVYANPRIDITDAVLERLRHPSAAPTP